MECNIVKNSLDLDIFCGDLAECFKDRDAAEFWFENYLQPAFDLALDDKFEENE